MLASGLASVCAADASTAAFAATLLRSRVRLHAAGHSFVAQHLRAMRIQEDWCECFHNSCSCCAPEVSGIRRQPFAGHGSLHRRTQECTLGSSCTSDGRA